MAVIETWIPCELNKPVQVHTLCGSLFSNNGNANRIGAVVTENGEPASLSGTVSGYAVLSNGTTVPCTGTLSSNKASILLPAAAYLPGSVFITVFLTSGTTVTTLAAVNAAVVQSRTDTQVDPGSVVTDWTTTINAAMQAVETAAENIGHIVATPYASLSFPVPLGKYTFYNNNLYRCTTPIATSEDFTAAHWSSAINLGDELRAEVAARESADSDLKSALTNTNDELHGSLLIPVDGTTLVQGSYNQSGTAIVENANVIRVRQLTPLYKGQKVIFASGTKVKQINIGYFSNSGTYISTTGWIDDGSEIEIADDQYGIIAFRIDGSTAITPSNYDAETSIVSVWKNRVDDADAKLDSLKTTVDQIGSATTGTAIQNTKKWILQFIPEKSYVQEVAMMLPGFNADIVNIELWETDDGLTYTLSKTIKPVSYTIVGTNFYKVYFPDFFAEKKGFIAYSDSSSLGWGRYTVTSGFSAMNFGLSLSAVTEEDITTVSSIKILYGITYYSSSHESSNAFVTVKKDGSGDYSSVANAVANEPSGTTIIVFPGVYDGSIRAFTKRVNIIGTDREKCVIRQTNGLYANPAMECCCGYLENLTFLSEYISGTSQEIGTENGAYAVHCENQGGETIANGDSLVFVNCNLVSDFFPALGCGSFKDWSLQLYNCRLTSRQTTDRGAYVSDGGLGALYFHDMNGTTGNAVVIVKDCIVESKTLANTMCLFDQGRDYARVSFEMINNTIYSAVNGFTDSVWWRNVTTPFGYHFSLAPLSHGNTGSVFNN